MIPSPLGYPGGKSKQYKRIKACIPPDIPALVSPFMGGGVVELSFAALGKRVYGSDIDPYVVNFWNHWLTLGHACIREQAERYLVNYDRQTIKDRKPEFLNIEKSENLFELAAWYYLYNRLSFSGKTFENYITKYTYVTDKYLNWIDVGTKGRQTAVFSKSKHWVGCMDWQINVDCLPYQEQLGRYPDMFAYLDPPYPEKQYVYGHVAKANPVDHKELFGLIKDRDDWVLSYNTDPLIMELYKDYRKIYRVLQEHISKVKKKVEVLILSKNVGEWYAKETANTAAVSGKVS